MLKFYRTLNPKHFLKCASNFSTKPMIKEPFHEKDKLKTFEDLSKIKKKERTKKPQRPPFVKNLLLGTFDYEMLTYPELSNEELNDLNKNLDEARLFLQQEEVKNATKISKSFLEKLAAGKLLGLQSSQFMGGRELSVTQSCRFYEAFSEIKLGQTLISNEVLAMQALLKFGNDFLKRKYLQKVINGESFSAFCLLEPNEDATYNLKVNAVKSRDGKTWVLNGQQKNLAICPEADFYVVLTNSDYSIKGDIKEPRFSAFVVERDAGGVSHTVTTNQLSDIVFENTPIPNENLIGTEHKAEHILSTISAERRLSTGPMCSVLLKNVINKTTQHVIDSSSEPSLLYETDAVRIRFGQFCASLYAVDSMVYLTSGLVDSYENQDVELEAAIVKVFALEQAFKTTSACLEMVGPNVCSEDHWCSQLHKEVIRQMVVEESNDNLKIIIALLGLRYAGEKMNDLVKTLRNPFYNAAAVMKRIWTQKRHADDQPSLNLYLYQYLHPSCDSSAHLLEYCVLRLQFAVETFLTRHGVEVVNQHADLIRLAECLVDIYAMVACLGRASRSYCIGLQHAEYEMALAAAFVYTASKRVKARLEPVIRGPFTTADGNFRSTAKRLFELKEYYPVHALTRNF